MTPYFAPIAGGNAVAPYILARFLTKKGHNLKIFTTDIHRNSSRFQSEADLAIVESHCKLNMSGLLYSPTMKEKLDDCADEMQVFHLHAFRTYQNIIARKFARKHKIPYILQSHGSIPRMGKKSIKWFYDSAFGYNILKQASKVIALTQAEAQQCKKMGVQENKIEIIPNGVDLTEFEKSVPHGVFRKKNGITEDKKIILFLGRLHAIKGIDVLIKAFVQLIHDREANDIVLVIAGPDDGYLTTIRSLVSQFNLQNKVVLVGPLYGKEKIEAYVDADIFVLPSIYETFPNVVLENYACSKPVIASNVESMKDIILHGKTGLLFQTCNAKELAEKITFMLTNPKTAKEMGLRAHKFAEEKFAIQKIGNSFEAVYEEVLQDKLDV